MTEIDFYVELLEEKECNRLLKNLGSATGGPLELKKVNIRRLLKRQTNATYKKKKNPFNFVLEAESIDSISGLNEKELFYFLSEQRKQDLPDYRKLANAILYYPDKTKEMLPQLIKSFKEGKPIFQFDCPFESDEEIIEYLKKTKRYLNRDSIARFVEYIRAYVDADIAKVIKTHGASIKKWSLKDLMVSLAIAESDFPNYAKILTYLISHIEKDDINTLAVMAYDIVIEIMEAHTEIITKFAAEKSHMQKSEEERIADVNMKLDELHKAYDKVIKEYEKESAKYLEENQTLNIRIAELEQLLEAGLTTEVGITQVDCVDKNTGINERDMLKQFRNQIDALKCEGIGQRGMAVVHAFNDVGLIGEIYPEIKFINESVWLKDCRNIKANNIEIILVQRQISSMLVKRVMTYSQENEISCNMFFASSLRDMLEQIGYYKKINGGI